MKQITEFSGDYRWLSNFWDCHVSLPDGPLIYPSVEHAYQAAKTNDHQERGFVHAAATPGMAKKRGRTVTMRPDWNEIKLTVMADLISEKFSPSHPVLMQALIDTGDAILIEGNTWGDTYWGMCRGVGENHLGHLLMERRKQLTGDE